MESKVKKFVLAATISIIMIVIVAAFLFNKMTKYYLTIENISSSIMTDVIITAPGVTREINTMKPESRIALRLSFKGDGALEFKAKQNGVEFDGMIESYVTGNMNGVTILRFKNDCQYEIISDNTIAAK
jgi:hypothetical protein